MKFKLAIFTALIFSLFLNVFAGKEDEIIEKYFETNGITKLKNIGTLLAKGHFNYMGTEVKFVSYFKNPAKYRNETYVEDQTYVGVFDGESGWASQQGQVIDLPPQAKAQVIQFVDLLWGPLFNYDKEKYKIKLIGREKIDGIDVFKINMQPVDREENADAYISTKDYQLMQFIAKSSEAGEIKFSYKDLKAVNGISLPHTIQINVQNFEQVINYDSIEIDNPVEDSLFAKP